MAVELIPGYELHQGGSSDRPRLVQFMRRTYRELYPDHDLAHLADTVERYFSPDSPLWWVYPHKDDPGKSDAEHFSPLLPHSRPSPVGCLWLGNAVDQVTGDRHAHIFLLYVSPSHRRQGIGTALVHYAENWAKQRGDRQMGLQVFLSNPRALHLYQKLGYQTHSLWMLKPLQ